MRECPRCERCFEDETLLCPDDQSKTKATLPGTTLLNGRYRLEKRLGRGAMGQVYVARDENLVTRRVAVKTIRPDVLSDEDLQEGEAIARFEREARTAASIQHPNIVGVTDFGKSEEGVFFLVMEYVEGESLYHLLRREGTITVQRAHGLLKQISAGVEAAHDEGILHRDLKPANVFIVQRKKKEAKIGGDDFVKVGDFGLAKIISQSLAGIASGSGPASRGVLGTPEYMAPEQMQSGGALDARADVYALGAMAYHMLAGKPPFTGDIMQIFAQKLTQDASALSTIRSDIPSSVEASVMRALSREADGRPATVGDWFAEFDDAFSGASVKEEKGESRVVIMAPSGAEVYVDDERHGSIGRSGRVILKSLPPGKHVLRVAHGGDADDERIIEVRPDADEQIIQAQFKSTPSSGLSPSQGGSLGAASGMALPPPAVVACAKCGSRFAAGTKFCGRCGSTTFDEITAESPGHLRTPPAPGSYPSLNQPPPSLNQPPPSLNQPPPSLNQPTLGGTGNKIRCTRCGVDQPAGTKFCGRCGASMGGSAIAWNAPPRPVEVLCPGCNSTYPSGTKFCGRCGRTVSPPPAPSVASDEVSCSIFAPTQASRGEQLLVQVFAHLIEQAAQVREIAKEFDETAQRRAVRTFAEPVARGSTIAFELVLPGIEIDEPVQRVTWNASREPQAVSFGVRVPKDYSAEKVIGTVIASIGNAPLGHIKFQLSIGDSQPGESLGNWSHSFVRYKRAFISYASSDRKEVLKRVQMIELAGTKYFQDLLNLDPGERWERALYREIDQSDVFYLFWSSAAKRSEWVLKEVEYALKRKGNDDSAPPAIVPVIIEGPPPVAPPPELAHLHFNHHIIYFMV